MASAQPLAAYPAFACSDLDSLGQLVEGALSARIAKLSADTDDVDVQARHFALPNSGLWFCSYGIPLSLDFPDNDFVRIQINHRGSGATRFGQEEVAVTKSQACISTGAISIDFGEDFQQFVWRIPKENLVRRLSVLLGEPVSGELNFDAAVDLDKPESAVMLRMLECIVHAAGTMAGEPARIVFGELEQTLITAFLTGTCRDFRAQLERPTPTLAPRQVRRVEAYIESNWDQPVSIDELAGVAGASARSIFRAFKQSRGYTPQEFARKIRLKRARDMLLQTQLSVTEIALACGFADASHFSREYKKAFGDRPSDMRRREDLAVA
ncbi:helix-turn-helix domain-containing protein [Dongia sp. agr-C8]